MVTPLVTTTLSDDALSGRYKTYTPTPSSEGSISRFKRLMDNADSSDDYSGPKKWREEELNDENIGEKEEVTEVIGVEQPLTDT